MLAAATGEGSTIPHGTAAVVLEIIDLPHGAAHARRRSQAPTRRDADMSTPTGQPIEPETDQERELLKAYRALADADRVLVWSALLTLLDEQGVLIEE